jgi:Kef-type K+ transport system membrane component KefB
LHIGVLDALNNSYGIATLWIALAFVASIVSVRMGLSVALVEILMGVLGGNLFGMSSNQWIDFLAGFGSVLLTFLAGAEIDPKSFRRFLTPSLVIGGVGFLAPCAAAWIFALAVLHWPPHGSEIAGIALSTTSVAVVYAVMLETGLNRTDLGKLILCACFVCDLGTVLALGIVFANYNSLLIAFGIATAVVMVFLPRSLRVVIRHIGHPISEPEVKYVFLLLFGLGALATAAKSEAVLPAYLLGLGAAGIFHSDPKMVGRVRGVAFTFLTPFFFLRAGTLIELPAVIAGSLTILLLFGGQGRCEGDRRVSGNTPIPHSCPGSLVHDHDDVDRPHIRDHRSALRIYQRLHRPVAVLDPGHCRGAHRTGADLDRPAGLQAAGYRTPPRRPGAGPGPGGAGGVTGRRM